MPQGKGTYGKQVGRPKKKKILVDKDTGKVIPKAKPKKKAPVKKAPVKKDGSKAMNEAFDNLYSFLNDSVSSGYTGEDLRKKMNITDYKKNKKSQKVMDELDRDLGSMYSMYSRKPVNKYGRYDFTANQKQKVIRIITGYQNRFGVNIMGGKSMELI
tara:strand:+ start:2755 stop:3225 length:471 start_codon:yes stop_codon:yes gene_type:complete